MYIYNTTFMVEQSLKEDFVQWFRSNALTKMVNPESPAREPRLTCVVDVPGDPEFAAQAASFAFQTEFMAREDADRWAEVYLAPVIGDFTSRYGADKALTFATVLTVVDL